MEKARKELESAEEELKDAIKKTVKKVLKESQETVKSLKAKMALS